MSSPSPDTRRRGEQERSRATRKRILDAAVAVLVEHGYSNATTVRIQQAAGVSRGRLLHHYPSRDALLVAAVHHLAAQGVQGLDRDRPWPTDPIARIAAAVDRMWWHFRQPYFWASMELWLAARGHEELRAELLPLERILGRMIKEQTTANFGPEIANRPRFVEVRDLIYQAMRGAALGYAIDPRDPLTEPQLAVWRSQLEQVLVDDEPTAATGEDVPR
ncbi:TetR/AcrR family transcriptional regulator [Rhodococcus sp. CSLK01-03]|uniref:TetR/AcrR family transcriptional regulator n=1 Tax=Rhodococcus indonesiensis TaxID=3055869 RepID=A0ABT7RUF9_9NOCA|nr:TetR/AcrR family transcriptional regulator [Rhodococcus indonesiensis]MDM7491292.1 TetR/AcrR family transcriptional regulator [Rhodococcus indonesiensis]